MEKFIRFILSNFTLTFFIIGLIFSFVSLYKNRNGITTAIKVETIFKYFCFWAHGISWIYNGIMHTVFHSATASLIGWEDSPFQLEVGFASLGFGIIGLIAIKKDFGLRLGLIIGTSVFLWGAAGKHLYEIFESGNFASGNAGIILWTDLLLPVFGIILLCLSKKYDIMLPKKN